MATTVKIEGFRELEDSLKQFSRSTGKNVLGRALAKAAEPVRAAAEAKAPKDTGALQLSIKTIIRRNLRNKGMVLAVIGPQMGAYRTLTNPTPYVRGVKRGTMRTYQIGSSPGVYGNWVEFGTSDTPAQPFMRPAWEAHKDGALEIMKTELAVEIDKAAARAARKAAKLAARG